jgi:hypothetical protein
MGGRGAGEAAGTDAQESTHGDGDGGDDGDDMFFEEPAPVRRSKPSAPAPAPASSSHGHGHGHGHGDGPRRDGPSAPAPGAGSGTESGLGMPRPTHSASPEVPVTAQAVEVVLPRRSFRFVWVWSAAANVLRCCVVLCYAAPPAPPPPLWNRVSPCHLLEPLRRWLRRRLLPDQSCMADARESTRVSAAIEVFSLPTPGQGASAVWSVPLMVQGAANGGLL